MARLSLITFLVLAFSGTAFAALRDHRVRTLRSIRIRDKDFSNCDSECGPNPVWSIDISPDPAVPGEQLNITVNAETDETIVDYSYATAEVSYGSELLWTRQIDICQKDQCPIEPGPYEFDYTIYMPREIPADQITIVTKGYSPQKKALFCFKFTPT